MQGDGRYYIVHESALPEGLKRVCLAQRLLMSGEAKSVLGATKAADVSRSAYYKYRDRVRPYSEGYQDSVVNLQAVLKNRAGVLSNFLNMVARAGANVVTVNQSIPVGDVAAITLSVNISGVKLSREGLIKKLHTVNGVESVGYLG